MLQKCWSYIGSILILGLIGASFGWPGQAGAASSAQELQAARSITLERTACMVPCPEYRVSIAADGTVVYEGLSNVKERGQRVGSARRADVEALLDEAERLHYLTLDDRYAAGEAGCPEAQTCSTTVVTSIDVGGQVKTVSHYHGCGGNPDLAALKQFEDHIDAVAHTERWIGTGSK